MMKLPDNRSDRLVYSTGTGRICPGCGAAIDQCACRQERPAAAVRADGRVRVRRETKGRGGKTVTTVAGLPPDADLREWAARLKRRCGTGGTVKDGQIEIQGDQVAAVIAELQRAGMKTVGP